METVEINRNILYFSKYPIFLDVQALFTTSVQENLNVSLLTKIQVKPVIPILEKLKQDPELVRENKKLMKELFDQKILVKILKRQMAEMKEEHRAREEARIRTSKSLEEKVNKQSEDTTGMMKEMVEMMKKFQQS